jgi:hypothetical protein
VWVDHSYDAAKARCAPDCSATRDRLQLRADVGYALLGLGGVALATGAVIWLRARTDDDRNVYVAPGPGGVIVGGRF